MKFTELGRHSYPGQIARRNGLAYILHECTKEKEQMMVRTSAKYEGYWCGGMVYSSPTGVYFIELKGKAFDKAHRGESRK